MLANYEERMILLFALLSISVALLVSYIYIYINLLFSLQRKDGSNIT